MLTRRRSITVSLLNLAFWAVVAYAAFVYVVPKWRETQLSGRLASLSPAYLTLAGFLIVGQYVSLIQLWRIILRLLGAPLSAGTAFHAYALSLLPRYVPGKVVGQGMRIRLAMAAGVPAGVAVSSLAWESVLGFASAAAIVVVGLTFGAAEGLVGPARWVVLAFVGLAGAVAVVLRLSQRGQRWRQWIGAEVLDKRPASVAALFGLYCGVWLLAMSAHWALALAIMPLPPGRLFSLLVALCVSWAVGMLSFIAPAGLGVREGVLFLFAQVWMGPAGALLFVTLSRLSSFAVEVALTAVAATMALARRRNTGSVLGSPTVDRSR
jgi:hypothetical protein